MRYRATDILRALRALPFLPLILVLLSAAGCAGTVQPMGPAVQEPRFTQERYVAADGIQLPLRAWLPKDEPRAVVVALHGFNDYSNAFAMPAPFLAEHGIATYAYDQRGFGATDRPGIWATADTLTADLRGAVTAARRQHPGVPLVLMGESMGGAVILDALTRTPPDATPLARQVEGVILSAPAVWGRDSMNPLYALVLWLARNTVPWMELTPPRDLKIVPSDNIAMLRALSRDPLVRKRTRIDAIGGLVDLMSRAERAVAALPPDLPILVMYGRNEQIIPEEPVGKALAALPGGARGAVYEKGYHMLLRDLQAETVWKDVAAWIADPSTPLPSGADKVAWKESPVQLAREAGSVKSTQ